MEEIFIMKNFKKLIVLIILLLLYLYVANITLMPKNIIIMQGEEIKLSKLWGINIKQIFTTNPNIAQYKDKTEIEEVLAGTNSDNNQSGRIDLDVSMLDVIPLKNITVSVIPKTTVIPLGDSIGMKLYTKGVLVVGMSEIDGNKPYENTGIEEGDRIIQIDSTQITCTEDLIETVNKSKGKELEIKYVKEDDETEMVTNIIPVKTKEDEYKLGLWVRDAAAGVGTVTFYEPSSGKFASLGHGITDVDTGSLVTIAKGELVTANILSIIKGKKGTPGELRGTIDGGIKLGDVYNNTKFGIFGKINSASKLQISKENEMEVLSRDKIKIGKAQIICEIETGNKKYYDIEIEKIYVNNNIDNKSMLIKITDKELLEKTGGIIQGMSGSPIIQDGKFVGAVTHVLVNDPTTGYGVFADLMLKEMAG